MLDDDPPLAPLEVVRVICGAYVIAERAVYLGGARAGRRVVGHWSGPLEAWQREMWSAKLVFTAPDEDAATR